MRELPDGTPGDPYPEQAHADTLDQGGASPVVERQTGNTQADAVVRSVTEKINGVGLQCDRPGREPLDQLEEEHRGIDAEDEPQQFFVPGVVPVLVIPGCMATSAAHDLLPSP